MKKAEWEQLSSIRLAEALHLLREGHHSGAYYLGGYAIEFALKACIAGLFQPGTIPDRRFVEKIYTHKLSTLLDLAQLEAKRSERSEADAKFARNWALVAQWSEGARYDMIGEQMATEFVKAVSDPDHGVFEWIKASW